MAVVPTAIVLKGYPRLSETFIAQEIKALEDAGLPIQIVSLRHPNDTMKHIVHEEIRAPVLYLPEYLIQEPLRVLRAAWTLRRNARLGVVFRVFLHDFARDRTANRVRRFGQALVLAAELDPRYQRLHAHFLHTPASVARYAALLLGISWSGSAHAVDIYTTPDWELAEKVQSCEWLVTCSAAGREHLRARTSDPDKVALVYHGIDLARFSAPTPRSVADGPIRILSVGRLVEKKGADDLLRALARLPAELDWRLVHVGGGMLAQDMKNLAQNIDIAHKIIWRGALTQDQVLAEYRDADIFVLASRVAKNGDRDGLPNVLLEAQSQRLACIATKVGAIPELIKDRDTGILVLPGDIENLALAIETLVRDPALRDTLAAAGYLRARQDFDFAGCIRELLPRFGLLVAVE
jgi:glycosyltransferase involved in cell wall biosynthesis